MRGAGLRAVNSLKPNLHRETGGPQSPPKVPASSLHIPVRSWLTSAPSPPCHACCASKALQGVKPTSLHSFSCPKGSFSATKELSSCLVWPLPHPGLAASQGHSWEAVCTDPRFCNSSQHRALPTASRLQLVRNIWIDLSSLPPKLQNI